MACFGTGLKFPIQRVMSFSIYVYYIHVHVHVHIAQNKTTPFSPVNSYPGSANSSGSSEVHPLALNQQTPSSGSRRSSADTEFSRQTSEMSVVSVEGSLTDNPALLKSLTKFQRFVQLQVSIIPWLSEGLGTRLTTCTSVYVSVLEESESAMNLSFTGVYLKKRMIG